MVKSQTHVSKEKIKQVEELSKGLSEAKCVMLVSIKSLPSAQFQKIKKSLRDRAKIKVAKKTVISKAIEKSGKKELEELKNYIKEGSAILLSDQDGFELALWLVENRNPISAKAGQIAEQDISVEPGPTDLVPGPVISEFGAFGIQIEVKEGKIEIKREKVVVAKGEAVKENAASLLQKLDIKPFMIGLNPEVIYESDSKKIYANLEFNKDKNIKDLIQSQSKSIGFAQKMCYYCNETISYLIGKASINAKGLENLKSEEVKEEKKENVEKNNVQEDNKEESE